MSTSFSSFRYTLRRPIPRFLGSFLCVTLFFLFFPLVSSSPEQPFFSCVAHAAHKKKNARKGRVERKREKRVRSVRSRYSDAVEDALALFRKRRVAGLRAKEETAALSAAIPKGLSAELPDGLSFGQALPLPKKHLPRLRSIVTSFYGERRSLGPNGFYFHSGLDIRAHLGWNIVAFRDGVVTKAGRNGNAGIMVEIEHEDGMSSLYAHMRRTCVTEGQRVVAGEKIGEVGCTGRTTGAHLHIAIRKNGGTVDPLRYLKGAEDVLRPSDSQIPDVLGPQQCNGHFLPYSPATANRSRGGVVIRGRRGRPVRVDLRALRNYRPPEIPTWQSRRR